MEKKSKQIILGAIVRAGGRKIQMESDEWIRRHGRLETGEVALTSGGNMLAPIVIHAVGPIYRDGKHDEDKELASATYNSILLAHEKGLGSLAIPAISSGIFGFPKPWCASIMFKRAVTFFEKYPDSTLKVIRFTNFDTPTVRVFLKQCNSQFALHKNEKSAEPIDTKKEHLILIDDTSGNLNRTSPDKKNVVEKPDEVTDTLNTVEGDGKGDGSITATTCATKRDGVSVGEVNGSVEE